jgi:hypothetical protein
MDEINRVEKNLIPEARTQSVNKSAKTTAHTERSPGGAGNFRNRLAII